MYVLHWVFLNRFWRAKDEHFSTSRPSFVTLIFFCFDPKSWILKIIIQTSHTCRHSGPLKTVSLGNLDLPPGATGCNRHHQDHFYICKKVDPYTLQTFLPLLNWALTDANLITPNDPPGTQVSPSLFGRLLPWHLACGPLWVGTGRRGRRRLHGAEAAAGRGTFFSQTARYRELDQSQLKMAHVFVGGKCVFLCICKFMAVWYMGVYGYYSWSFHEVHWFMWGCSLWGTCVNMCMNMLCITCTQFFVRVLRSQWLTISEYVWTSQRSLHVHIPFQRSPAIAVRNCRLEWIWMHP